MCPYSALAVKSAVFALLHALAGFCERLCSLLRSVLMGVAVLLGCELGVFSVLSGLCWFSAL